MEAVVQMTSLHKTGLNGRNDEVDSPREVLCFFRGWSAFIGLFVFSEVR